jgi:hypothetical protein
LTIRTLFFTAGIVVASYFLASVKDAIRAIRLIRIQSGSGEEE